MAEPTLPRNQLEVLAGEDKYVQGVVDITLTELIEEDYVGLHQLLAERLIGADIQEKLTDLTYNIVGCTAQVISMKVRGSIRLWLRKTSSAVSEKDDPKSE
jgi:hypothetical protein